MKLRYFILIIILCPILLISCNFRYPDYFPFKNKPNGHFYTEDLFLNLNKDENFSCRVYESNLHKEASLNKEQLSTLTEFFSSLTLDNFVEKPKDFSEKPVYKMFITANSKKYIIDIYNDTNISIYPWDGNYDIDFINMKNIHSAYNLFSFCKYTINNPK
ncbi:DUF4883 family protein [Clostridium sp. MSJ-4]|uniref:DUF4883 family protein n=1 Tax=Clostridium simiarum TaxID=2841506 RepID=A0ABS6F2R1_9CLOT|nr:MULTISPECIES: DUF4883 family protein [Clostridium]MBU5592799.1 DUF4883 family protein [Clostridium simiarum]